MPNLQRLASRSLIPIVGTFLFGLAFAAIGVLVTAKIGNMLVTWHSAQSWPEVPAQILRTELENHRGNKGGMSYKTTAKYIYEYGGQKYMSYDVGLSRDSDNVGSFQQDAYRELIGHQKSGRSFRCYVNPARPEQTLLYRDLRWGMLMLYMIFLLFSGGVGSWFIIAAVLYFQRERSCAALIKAHPKMPWMWKPDWAEGQIIFSSQRMAVFSVMAAVFWNLVSSPLWLVLPDEILHKKNYYALFGLLLPVAGLGLIVWVIVSILRWRKFGASVFRMASVPGVIGGQLAGIIQTSAKIWPADGFHLTLSCVRRVGIGRNTQEDNLWQKTQTVAHELLDDMANISAIPVEFQIPYDCHSTDETEADDRTLWRLKATAKEPGFNYSATFDVPVFKMPESNPRFIDDTQTPANSDRKSQEADILVAIFFGLFMTGLVAFICWALYWK